MKINFDAGSLQTMETRIPKSNISVNSSKDINVTCEIGRANADLTTYEGRKKSMSELKAGFQATDVNVTQNYMTVMSHTVSEEDYKKMVEDGVNPMDIEVRESTTILDHIKLYVAKGGTSVEGFTDTLDSETIKAISGLEAVDLSSLASEYDVTLNENINSEIEKAIELASDVTEITEGMKLFFMNSEAEVSADSLYLAKHSASNVSEETTSGYFGVETKGYLVKKGEIGSNEELTQKIKELLENTGIEVSPENIENSVWLVKNSIPVNEKNLIRLAKINSIQLPLSQEKLARVYMNAVNEGIKPSLADITQEENVYKQAVSLAEEIKRSVDTNVLAKTINFEETRLKMITEANLLLLKSDFSIDTDDLEKYIEALKQIESDAGYTEALEFETAIDTIEAVKATPADVIGLVYKEIKAVSINDIFEKGDTLREQYEKAGKAYEQLGTEVRKDLGDSIKKAFSNVDDILDDLGFEKTDDNRRAVRILGYNSMKIDATSVKEIKEADRKVQSALSRITPMDSLNLIRQGKSPLTLSIDELNNYLDENSNSQQKEIEKYSKFLFKLEKSGDITEAERKEYIEVYRFFHQLEKGDMAAIGSVLNAGNALTITNLKTAIKTSKSGGMDVKIDDSFGFLVNGISNELEPEKLKAIPNIEDMTLENLYDSLEAQSVDKSLEKAYTSEQLSEMRESLKAPDEVVNELLMNKMPVTANTLSSVKSLMKHRGDDFSTIMDIDKYLFDEISGKIVDALTDVDSAQSAYEESILKAEDAVYEQALSEGSYIDVKTLQHVHIALSVARGLSDSETYEVPMEIGGVSTSVNLKIVHNKESEPNVVVSFETEEMGRVSARLTKENGEIKGYISCNLRETLSKMEKVADILGKEVYTVVSGKSDNDSVLASIPMKDNSSDVSSSELYETAKAFLEAVKGNY